MLALSDDADDAGDADNADDNDVELADDASDEVRSHQSKARVFLDSPNSQILFSRTMSLTTTEIQDLAPLHSPSPQFARLHLYRSRRRTPDISTSTLQTLVWILQPTMVT